MRKIERVWHAKVKLISLDEHLKARATAVICHVLLNENSRLVFVTFNWTCNVLLVPLFHPRLPPLPLGGTHYGAVRQIDFLLKLGKWAAIKQHVMLAAHSPNRTHATWCVCASFI